MAVGVFEKPLNIAISTCQNFDEVLYICKDYEQCFTRGDYTPVFCLDRQAVDEWKTISGDDTPGLCRYKHPDNPIYIFGKDAGMKMASHLLQLLDGKHEINTLTIDTTPNSVFWYAQAIAIVLYDKWYKHEMAMENVI